MYERELTSCCVKVQEPSSLKFKLYLSSLLPFFSIALQLEEGTIPADWRVPKQAEGVLSFWRETTAFTKNSKDLLHKMLFNKSAYIIVQSFLDYLYSVRPKADPDDQQWLLCNLLAGYRIY